MCSHLKIYPGNFIEHLTYDIRHKHQATIRLFFKKKRNIKQQISFYYGHIFPTYSYQYTQGAAPYEFACLIDG